MADDSSSTSGFTLEKLKLLEDAVSDGVKRIKYQDKEIEYRSLDEMKDIINGMRKALGTGKKGGQRGLFGGRRIVARHSKGLDE